MLTDRSWDGLWGDLLYPELPGGDPLLDDNGNKGSDATFANIEDIELWAEQSLPGYDPPSDTVPLPLSALPDDQRLDAGLQQCYGMVRRPGVGSRLRVGAYSLPIDLPCVGESRGKYGGC